MSNATPASGTLGVAPAASAEAPLAYSQLFRYKKVKSISVVFIYYVAFFSDAFYIFK